MLAIKLAADKLLEIKKDSDRYIKIFSDSQAALKSLNSWKIKSKLVGGTINSLNKLASRACRLELNWIKAHNNYEGNERADELAKNAVYNNVIYFGLDPPHSYFKKQLRNAIYDDWNTRWVNEKSCRMTKIFYPRTHKGKSKSLINMSRKKSRRIIEIVPGQNNLHYIQNKVTSSENVCRFCEEEEETFHHLILECPCFYTDRTRIMKNKLWEGTHHWKLDEIYEFSKIQSINKALNQDSSEDED